MIWKFLNKVRFTNSYWPSYAYPLCCVLNWAGLNFNCGAGVLLPLKRLVLATRLPLK